MDIERGGGSSSTYDYEEYSKSSSGGCCGAPGEQGSEEERRHLLQQSGAMVSYSGSGAAARGPPLRRRFLLESDEAVALPSSGYFDVLPDELVLCILSFSTGKEIAQMARTCRRMHALAGDPAAWDSVARSHNWPLRKAPSYYIKQYAEEAQRNLQERENARREEISRRAAMKKRRAELVVLTSSSRCWDFLYLILLALFFAFLILKLDNHIQWNWFYVVLPLCLLLVHLYLNLMIFLCLRQTHGVHIHDPTDTKWCQPVILALILKCSVKPRAAAIFFAIVILPLLFLGAVYLHCVMGLIPLHIIPLPLYIFALALLIGPSYAATWRRRPGKQTLFLSSMWAGLCIATSTTLFEFRLLGWYPCSWLMIVTPLIALHGFMSFLPMWLMTCGRCCCTEFIGDDTLDTFVEFFLVSLVGFVMAPLELLLALKADLGWHISWAAVFSPFFLGCSFMLCLFTLIQLSFTPLCP
ncbi:hypothetical protein Pelo_13395 [Pelomyxa schiedti]|nr:hypothetical protein Pelo_13395 [Pelomyxa schiedti]